MRKYSGYVPWVCVPLLMFLGVAFIACSPHPSRNAGPLALQPPIADPIIKVIAPETAPGISFLSWDTEGGEKTATNLLRAGSAVRAQFLADGAWIDAKLAGRRPGSGADVFVYGLEAGTARLEWRVVFGSGSLTLTFFALDANSTALVSIRLIFPFDPKVTSTTVLPGDWLDDGTFRLPAVLNAPDWGPMLLAETKGRPIIGRLEGSRAAKIVDLTLDLPEIIPDEPVTLSLTPLLLPPPPGLRSTSLWLAARRGWLNALQPCARWGEQDKPFSAPPGILGNNVISDPASVSIWFYADQAFFMPEIAPGISVMPLVRRTIDYWLDQRMRRDADGRLTGEITGYWDYGKSLKPGSFSAAGKHQQAFRMAIGTADAGKPTARIAAVEVALDDFFDYRAEEAVLLLEAALVLRQKTVKIMEQHSIKGSPLGMPRTIHSRHSGRMASKNGPKTTS